ncbi:TIGR02594 family protein [Rhodopseudomonas sp. B29]|uniref:TIGR02594 family protein n=1 Tax=Rhodopseudomonas sp. B29 TaxID=95607 RepID=UPI0003452611|nr:TIGR02594 family protein [Rhodopseudomonas sp. B29]
MVEFTAFRLSRIAALVLSAVALAVITSNPASARPRHHHAHASRHYHHVASYRAHEYRGYRMSRRQQRAARVVQQQQFGEAPFGFAAGYQDPNYQAPNYQTQNVAAAQPMSRRAERRRLRQQQAQQAQAQVQSWSPSGAASSIVAEARSFIGRGNPTGRSSLWCARFMNLVLQRSGHSGTGSDMASSFAHYGQRISGPQVGAIAVMSRRGGGHVGVVSGIDQNGNPIVVSGNHNHRVAEAVYSKSRVYAYVMPSS